MRTLTASEKRTIRFAGIGLGIYLVLFGGYHARAYLTAKRSEYELLVQKAEALHKKIGPYQTRALSVQKLMEDFKVDPLKLSRSTVVAEASAAIQRAATSGGMQVGPIRESPARASARDLATVQFEGSGQIAAVMGLLDRLETIGFPVIIDSVQITPDNRPGQLKLTMTISILDFEKWKVEDKPNA